MTKTNGAYGRASSKALTVFSRVSSVASWTRTSLHTARFKARPIDCQFRSLNSYNYYQKEELCLHELLPFFLPSVCPSVLRQLRHNGAFVIAGRSVNGHH